MKYLLTGSLILYFIGAYSQSASNEKDILTCSQKRIGVYMSFAEFRTNSPSVSDTAVLRDGGRKFKGDSGPAKNVWGFCTGEKVYYLFNNEKGFHYVELKTVDRYCFFTDYFHFSSPTASGSVPSGVVTETEYVININNGNPYELSKKMMTAILEQDAELFSQFKADKGNKEKYRFYIEEFCRRNPSQIKPFKI